MIFHTSGSTGTPRLIDIPDSDLYLSARTTIEFFNLSNSSVLASPLPAKYIAGKMMEIRAEVAGCRLITCKPSNTPFTDNEIAGIDNIDLLAIVPSQIPGILENKRLLEITRNIIVGGAPVPQKDEQKMVETGINCFATYGMTETASHVALRPFGTDTYKALADITFTTDKDSRLIIHSDERSFKQLKTNDIVELITDTCFRWITRYDNVINSGGIKLFPEEIEKLIDRYIESPFYLAGVKSEKWGEEMHMFILDPQNEINDEILIARLKEFLDPYLIPKKIHHVKEFSTTSSGKIKRDKKI